METLEYPFTEDKVRSLRIGNVVRVSGRLFTGRDRVHKYLYDGGRCPVNLRDGGIFHCGPVGVRRDRQWVIRSAGPTTSIRQDRYTPDLIAKHGVRLLIGKGGMGDAVCRACVASGCIYVQAVGGAAAVLGSCVQNVEGVHFLKEFGMAEALWVLHVKDLEGVVTMDTQGKSLHGNVQKTSRQALNEIW